MTPALMAPFGLTLDLASGTLAPATSHVRRHLSEMRGMYADRAAEERLLAAGDPLIYEVLQYDMPAEHGHLVVCTTILHPGRVGDEYFMTKGHYHARRETGEVYLGLAGKGTLLLQEEGGGTADLPIAKGLVAYVPPYWAHRSVNIGGEPLAFFAVYPADAGHDYATIERTGFTQRVIAVHDGQAVHEGQAGRPAR